MSNMDEKNIAKDIFYLNEDVVYKIIEEFNNQVVDKSLVYCFAKAFVIHTVKVNCLIAGMNLIKVSQHKHL